MTRTIARLVLFALSLIVVSACSTAYNSQQALKSAKVHTELAGLYYQRGQMDITLQEVSKALSADPNYAPAYSVRGLAHMALHEDKEAEADFKRSLSLDSSDSDTHNNYGWFLCQRERASESIPQFMEAVKNPLYPTPGIAYLNAGICSKKMSKSRDAEDFFKKALSSQPDLTKAMYALAELKFADGSYIAAKKYFEDFAQRTEDLTSEQLWLGVRISRKAGDGDSEASYSAQLRNRFPDAPETGLLIHGE
jgi:type IV pilus assembly protein PilF